MRCFRHHETDSVGICRACGRGVCSACAGETDAGIACSDDCGGKLAEIAALTAHGRRAYETSARIFGFIAALITLLGLSVILVSQLSVMAPVGKHLAWWGIACVLAGPLVFLLGRRYRMGRP